MANAAKKTIKGALAALVVLGSLTWIVTVPTVASATPNATAARANITSHIP